MDLGFDRAGDLRGGYKAWLEWTDARVDEKPRRSSPADFTTQVRRVAAAFNLRLRRCVTRRRVGDS